MTDLEKAYVDGDFWKFCEILSNYNGPVSVSELRAAYEIMDKDNAKQYTHFIEMAYAAGKDQVKRDAKYYLENAINGVLKS